MATRYLRDESDIKSFGAHLFSPKYSSSVGRVAPDYSEIVVSGDAYGILQPFVKSNSVWNTDVLIPVKAVSGAFNPVGAVVGVFRDLGQHLIGDLIDPPSELVRSCRCIGSYYRHVKSDSGSELRSAWGPYEYRR